MASRCTPRLHPLPPFLPSSHSHTGLEVVAPKGYRLAGLHHLTGYTRSPASPHIDTHRRSHPCSAARLREVEGGGLLLDP